MSVENEKFPSSEEITPEMRNKKSEKSNTPTNAILTIFLQLLHS
jgi:hypothetical protein